MQNNTKWHTAVHVNIMMWLEMRSNVEQHIVAKTAWLEDKNINSNNTDYGNDKYQYKLHQYDNKNNNNDDLPHVSHLPVTLSHWLSVDAILQLQNEQPFPELNPHVSGAHWSHRSPMTLGLHTHCPVVLSHDSAPVTSQSHSGNQTIRYSQQSPLCDNFSIKKIRY